MRAFAVLLSCALLATPAVADDYTSVVNGLSGLTKVVTVLCPNSTENMLRIVDVEKSDTYSLLSQPSAPSVKARVMEACATGEPVHLEVTVTADRYGSVDIVPIDIDPFGTPGMALEEFRLLINETLKTITEVRGTVDLTTEDLMNPNVQIDGYEGSGIFFLTKMKPRRAIAYFNECYQICPDVIFLLETPPELPSYGMSALIYPTDWKLPPPGKNK